MANRYNVQQHNEHVITLKRVGIHLLGSSQVMLYRTQIAAVQQSRGTITVATTDGHTYLVNPGLRQEQRDLVRAAFRL